MATVDPSRTSTWQANTSAMLCLEGAKTSVWRRIEMKNKPCCPSRRELALPWNANETWRHKLRPSSSAACMVGISCYYWISCECRMLSQKLSRITLKMSDFEEYEQLKKAREKEMDTSQNGGQSKSPHGSTLKIKSSRSGTVRASTPEHQLQPSD